MDKLHNMSTTKLDKMKKMSTTQQQLTLSLKLSLLLTESGTSVDGWFGSSWSKWIACTKKGSHLRIHLAVLPPPDSLSDHLGTWWGRGLSVRVCECSTILTCPSTSASHPCQARSGCRLLQRSTLHQRWSQWQRPSECWKKKYTKHHSSNEGWQDRSRIYDEFSLTCGGATGLADCSWWGLAPLLSWNNQATPEVVRFKECMIYIFARSEWPLIIDGERICLFCWGSIFARKHNEKAP